MAVNNGPFIPEGLPLTPGWPPSETDLAPVLEDSTHFFYIADVLNALKGGVGDGVTGNEMAVPPPLRLALFNLAEAWMFAFLPLLLRDRRRLPLLVIFTMWFGGLGLTNAFLAPYMAVRELLPRQDVSPLGEMEGVSVGGSDGGTILSLTIGVLSGVVVTYALLQIIGLGMDGELDKALEDFGALVISDRTYLAFCVDLSLFSFFQVRLFQGVRSTALGSHNIPLLGLLRWLLFPRNTSQ